MNVGRAAILAIGTELTDGQVINSNAAIISTWLSEFNLRVIEHRCVPDERQAMRSALIELSRQAQLVVVCGGLGPTSDDFTRDVLAEVFACPLVWDERSEVAWRHISERLQSRGVTAQQNQRQQAWFPKGARIFPNREGTAAGFALVDVRANLTAIDSNSSFESSYILALPGPPREVSHLWKMQIRADLETWVSEQNWLKKDELMVWRTLGRGEGSLDAELEPALREWADRLGRPRLKTGYRAHAPYVDLKIWISDPWSRGEIDAWMMERYGHLIIGLADTSLMERVLSLCASRRIWDQATGGRWLRRILDAWRGSESLNGVKSPGFDYVLSESEPEKWDFSIQFDVSTRRVIWRSSEGEEKSAVLPALAGLWPSERQSVWIVEVALLLAAGEALSQLQPHLDQDTKGPT